MDNNKNTNVDYSDKDAIKALTWSGIIILTMWLLSFVLN